MHDKISTLLPNLNGAAGDFFTFTIAKINLISYFQDKILFDVENK